MLEASPSHTEWLVWLADEEQYHGNVRLEVAPANGAVELRVTLDYEPRLALFERLAEWLSNTRVEHTLRSDLAAFKHRLEHGANGEAT